MDWFTEGHTLLKKKESQMKKLIVICFLIVILVLGVCIATEPVNIETDDTGIVASAQGDVRPPPWDDKQCTCWFCRQTTN